MFKPSKNGVWNHLEFRKERICSPLLRNEGREYDAARDQLEKGCNYRLGVWRNRLYGRDV